MKNYVYLRISTKEQKINQLKDCLSVCPVEDPEVVREEQSAWSDNLAQRPKFKAVRDAVLDGKVKSITVWDLDRIYRKRIQSVEFLELCYSQNVAIFSYRQMWLKELEDLADKLPKGFGWIADWIKRFMLNLLGWIAEEESDKRSERVKAAFNNHSGKKWGRPTLDLEMQTRILNLREAKFSYRAIRDATGVSLGKISEICKEAEL